MEHGCPSLADQLATCQQRIRELEQTTADQQAVIAQQQEAIAAYQEQLAKAAEQLRFFKRAMFGQRRERYAPSPDQKLLFVPEAVEGLDAKQQNSQDANADSPPPRTRRKPRRPRIEFPQFWEHRQTEYPLSRVGIALRLLRGPADHHPHPRHEAGGDGRGEAVRGRRGAVHLRLFRTATTARRCRPREAAAGRGEEPLRAEHPGLAGDLEVPAPLAGLSAAGTAAGSAEAVAVAGTAVRAVESDGPGFAASGTIDPPAGARQHRHQRRRNGGADAQAGHGKAITGYLSGYAGDADHRYVFYDFRPSRSRDGPREVLADYRGYLQTDGYIVYTSLVREAAGRLVDVACWAHGRRGFEEAIPATSHPLVHEAMIWTQQLYDIEDRAKEMSPDDRRALRQAEALPILARMKARFDEVRPTLRPTAKLAEAIDYVLNRWDAFVRYTSDGRIPIDNNVIERLLRPVAIGRKNYLFFGSEKGGKTAATLYTLVQSARRNCVDVWPYLTDVLRRIAAIAPGDTAALEALLPDRWVAAHPEHRLEQREEESREAQARRRRKRAARRLAAAQ